MTEIAFLRRPTVRRVAVQRRTRRTRLATKPPTPRSPVLIEKHRKGFTTRPRGLSRPRSRSRRALLHRLGHFPKRRVLARLPFFGDTSVSMTRSTASLKRFWTTRGGRPSVVILDARGVARRGVPSRRCADEAAGRTDARRRARSRAGRVGRRARSRASCARLQTRARPSNAAHTADARGRRSTARSGPRG